MLDYCKNMDWRNRVFTGSWMLTLWLLPWQSRWFFPVELAGWPWEQGTWSIVLSMFPMFFSILWIWIFCKPTLITHKRKSIGIAILFVISVFATRGNPLAIQAISFWWFSCFLLASFAWSLMRKNITKEEVMWIFFLTLIPHALLGIWQYADQFVFPSTWLGMASQDPRMLGVSVVEHGKYRLLRAYGGFPHPNIFGGWLAIGLLNALLLSRVVRKKYQAIGLAFGSALLMMALILTYSRSSWIAFGVGFVWFIGWNIWKKNTFSSFFWAVCISIILSGAIVSISQRSHVFSRFQTETRLEKRSISERVTSLKDAGTLFLQRPYFGFGPNAEMLGLVSTEKTKAPLQPPHTIFVLFVLDFGLIGSLIFIWIIVRLKFTFYDNICFPFIIACVILGLFDHYLWSYWSGRCLLMIICLFCFLPRRQKLEEG
ncbi:O-antigen ligase family protein [Candidatus Uhrbacteria bacterium]|nr:O-antigen ligase family protein [Candidatus Uhrbacteria bacterium]